jgi:transposase
VVRKKTTTGALLTAQIHRAGRYLPARVHASLDSTGWDAHYASRYFLQRCRGRTQRYMRWVKTTFVCDHSTHLILAIVSGHGPGNDAPYFPAAIRQAAQRRALFSVSADKAYDAEAFHALCREELGARKTAIPVNPRNSRPGLLPGTRYRRAMALRFPTSLYGQRSHAECVVSQCKRRICPCLKARSDSVRIWESELKALTFNTLLLAELRG